MGTKVLELSPWDTSIAKVLYEDAKVDIWDFTSPIPEEYFGKYDAVISNNTLQRVNYMNALATINAMKSCLREGGELHVIVPALEWACREVLSENPSPACMVVLYGGQGADGSVHTSGYTMRLLRAHFERSGLSATKATTSIANINIGNKEYEILQHYVCGVNGKPELKK